MQQTFTQFNLLKYLYSETDIIESFMLEQQMSYDIELKESYQTLKNSKDLLGSVSLSPSQASIDFIMAYSELTKPLEEGKAID